MSQQTQVVEAKLRLVIDKDGVKAVNALTGAVVATARAEDNLAAAARRRGEAMAQAAQKARGLPISEIRRLLEGRGGGGFDLGGTADRATMQIAQKQALQAELERRGVLTRPGPPSVADRVRSALEQDRQATWERYQQRQVSSDLAAMGRNPDGSRMSLADRFAARTGVTPRAAGVAATAAVATAVKTGQGYAEFGRIDADPWMTERQKLEAKARANPFAGRAYGLFKDIQETYTGERQLLGRFERAQAEAAVRVQGRNEVDALRQRLGYERQDQAARAVAYNGVPNLLPGGAGRLGGLTLDRPDPRIDRATAQGRREYEAEARLLPLRQQATKAAVERVAAEERVRRLTADEAQRLREVGEAERRVALTREGRQRADADRSGFDRSGAKAGGAGAAGVERDSFELAKAARDRYQTAAEERKAAEVDLARKRFDENRSRVAVARETYAAAREREARAVGGAAALSDLGLGGRELAKQGLQLLKQGVSPDELPDDIKAAVGRAAPTALAEAQERHGERFKGEFRSIRPDLDEFRPADERRRETDRARGEATALDERGLRDFEQRLSGVMTKGFEDAMVAAVQRATEAAVQKIEMDRFCANASPNR